MRFLTGALLLTCLLSACGADGEPERPEARPVGISLSGTASVGVSGGS